MRTQPVAETRVAQHIVDLGGSVQAELRSLDTLVASIPGERVAALRKSAGVLTVSADRPVRLAWTTPGIGADYPGSMTSVTAQIGAQDWWRAGYTGSGVDVALIDSGVAPVTGLTGQVVNGPDLSLEGQAPNLAFLDTFGHGTHMAGIIAGRDPRLPMSSTGAQSGFLGVAPGARIINVKVAAYDGAVDVSQVLAAIDWVLLNRGANNMKIRVLCLAFGTDSLQSYAIDPLAHAVEVAWRTGLTVVCSAGNSGARGMLSNPATNPNVIAVGAADTKGTMGVSDDVIPLWSSTGNTARKPDLVAPGKSIVSLRDPNGAVDVEHPGARIGERFFVGSGTSQAAAVVAGAAALIIDRWDSIRPAEVKRAMTTTAQPIPGANPLAAGAGELNLKPLLAKSQPYMSWSNTPTTKGTGSLEFSRGSAHLADEGVVLSGERDILGHAWSAREWASRAAKWEPWDVNNGGIYWSGGLWMLENNDANRWILDTGISRWTSSDPWSGRSWSGRSWSGRSWSGRSWSANAWSGRSWSSDTWARRSWSADNWARRSWSTCGWGLEP